MEHRLWNKGTCGYALLSLLVATGISLTVCAAQGQLNGPVEPAAHSVSAPPSSCSTVTGE